MKRLGFLTGAVIAGVGVFLFNQWKHVSDDDRLTEILTEHCLPYVQTGATPFQNIGRSPGVYDDVLPNEQLTESGMRLIYDLRFVAHWGVSTDFENPTRVCLVQPTYWEGAAPTFEVETDAIIQRYTNRIPQLRSLATDMVVMGGDLKAHNWQETERLTGLRVSLLAGPRSVSNVVVTDDIQAE